MASKSKEIKQDQKAYWEEKLNQRLSILNEKGVEPEKIAKDSAVRKIRAKIRKSVARLKAITNLEKRTEEMAKAKAEKMAAPKKEKGKKKKELEAEVMSKRQQKKKQKKESKGKGGQ